MKYPIIQLLIITLLFASCGPGHPEAVLGIRLGMPEQSQINDLISRGKLTRVKDKNYIDYGTHLNKVLSTSAVPDEKEIDVLTGVTIEFGDPDYDLSWAPESSYVSEFDVKMVLQEYKDKYGEPTSEKACEHDDCTAVQWDRGTMYIRVFYMKRYAQLNGKNYFVLTTIYSYNDAIRDRMEAESRKNNKNI